MPRHIIDETGKRIRVWDDEEIRTRYLQGRQDAGDTAAHEHMFSEADVKKAYEEGSKANSKASDRLLGAAVRSGFEEGYKEGEEIGVNLGRRFGLESVKDAIEKAKKTGYEEGLVSGRQSTSNDVYNHGYSRGMQEANKTIERNKEYIRDEVISEYKKSQRFSSRIARQVDAYMAARQNGFLRTLVNWVGRIPLSGRNYDGHENLPGRSREYFWRNDSFLRLSDFRAKPVEVPHRFVAIYIIVPIVLYQTLSTAFKKAKAKLDLVIQMKKYGETKKQYFSRKKIEQQCDKVENVTPASLGLPEFTFEQLKELDTCRTKCADAKNSYDIMFSTMNKRRKLGIGNQRYYGIRTTGGYEDTYDEKKDKIIASPGILPYINQSLDTLILASVSQASEDQHTPSHRMEK